MENLSNLKCVACRGGGPTLTDSEITELHPQVSEWQIKELDGINRLERQFKFKNFVEALDFTNKVSVIAEEQDHHPMIVLEWGRVTIQWWTHVVRGLHRNDFIMAARTDDLYRSSD